MSANRLKEGKKEMSSILSPNGILFIEAPPEYTS
jgi:hypothetical protein